MSKLTRYAWFVVAYNVGVILWGAYVRATGSGAGCGRHWPLCNGEVLPRSPSVETLIELSHRLTSGLDGFFVLGLLIAVFRAFPTRHRARWAVALSMVFLLIEAAVGAGLVKFELVVNDDSMARAVVMAVHLVNTFLLLAALTLTALWTGGIAAPRRQSWKALPWLLGLGTLGLLMVGMSGAVTALGDTVFPDRAFAWEDLSVTSHFLLRLRILHPALSVLVGLYVLLASWTLGQRLTSPWARRSAGIVGGLTLVQLAAGFVNVELAAPVWMQMLHLLLADGLWIAWVVLGATALAAESPGPETLTSPARGEVPVH